MVLFTRVGLVKAFFFFLLCFFFSIPKPNVSVMWRMNESVACWFWWSGGLGCEIRGGVMVAGVSCNIPPIIFF